MYTYIIESQGYYKIGKAKDVDRRLKDYNTHNPVFKLIIVIGSDCEKYLHLRFATKRFKYEWFKLLQEDIKWIRDNQTRIDTFITEENIKELTIAFDKFCLEKHEEEGRIKRLEKEQGTPHEQRIIRYKIASKEIDIERMKNFYNM